MMPYEAAVVLIVAGALFATGLFSLMARCNLIKMVIGLELLGKSISLIFILGGYLNGNTGISEAVVFTLITIEAVVAGLALALVILARRIWKTFDLAAIARLTQEGEP